MYVPARRLRALGLGAEKFEDLRPATVDVAAHLCSRLGAQLLELAVLELDPRRIRALGDEAHLDFGPHRGIGLPLAVDVPRHHEALRRLPNNDPADIRLRAI